VCLGISLHGRAVTTETGEHAACSDKSMGAKERTDRFCRRGKWHSRKAGIEVGRVQAQDFGSASKVRIREETERLTFCERTRKSFEVGSRFGELRMWWIL
jgi:hypothetical protein